MKNAEQEYRAALADFSQPGGRWNAKGRLTYWGKAAGLTAEEIVSDARAAGVTDRDADIRRGWNDAKPRGDHRQGGRRHYAPRAKPKPPPTFPSYVRDMVAAGGGAATSADLRALSPVVVPKDGAKQTAAFLRSLFDTADILYIFRDDTPTTGKPGQNLKPCRGWLAELDGCATVRGDLIVPNPFTGEEADTTDGRKSYIAQAALARFPFIVVEFDDLPLPDQAAFWRGLLARSPLGAKVAALVYSGGKSIHGLLFADCLTLAEWQGVREQLRRLLAADFDPAFRADEQAMRPRTGVRLPGVRRFGTGRRQELLYLAPEVVRPTAEPRETPQTRPTNGTGEEMARADGRATRQKNAIPCDSAPVTAKPPAIFAAYCAQCPAVERCKQTFGRFWRDKSSGGTGCNVPLPHDARERLYKPSEQNPCNEPSEAHGRDAGRILGQQGRARDF